MSAKPFGYRVPRITAMHVIIITLCMVGVVRQCLLHDWSDAINTGIFAFTFWCWSIARRESEAWQSWYDWTRSRVKRP